MLVLTLAGGLAACGESDETTLGVGDARDVSDTEVLIDPGFRDTWSTSDGAGRTDAEVDGTANPTEDVASPGDTASPQDTNTADLLTPETSPRPCDLPWGGSIAHGLSVTAYAEASVTCGGSCASEVRVCNDGTLSGTSTAQTCLVESCLACTLPWGGGVAHGGSVTAYSSGSASCGKQCVSEARTCEDGELSGSYAAQACTVAPCGSCTLPWGGSIAHGATVTAYASAAPACGGSCASEVRTCSDGTLVGSYTAQACAVASCPPEIIFSTSFGGAAMTSFRMDRPIFGRLRNLTATNTESCAEAAGAPAPNCHNGMPWTRLPNADWSYDTTTSEWRAIIAANTYPAITVEVFVRNMTTGQQANQVLAITNPCYWTAIVAGPVSPPTSPTCTSANVGATTDFSGYTWTCTCN